MKSLAKNSLYNVAYKCANVFFPLVTISWVSRILLPEGVGKVSSAQNIVSYFAIVAALGLPTYGTKVIAACTDSGKQRDKRFSELFIINAVSTAICSFVYYTMIFAVPYFEERRALYAVCGLQIIFNFINVDWFYQGNEDYGYIVARSMIIKIASVIACLTLVRNHDDFIIYAAITTLSTVANYIFNIVHLRKHVHFTISNISVGPHIKPVLIMLAASLAIEVYTLADTTMLTFICGDKNVGYYANAAKCIGMAKAFATSICAVFLPRLSYYYASKNDLQFNKLINMAIKILFAITIPTCVGIVCVADDLIPLLYGNSFTPAILTVRILSVSIVSVAFSNFFGYQVLVTVGKEKQMMYSTIIGAVVNIVLNIILIYPLQYNGVAIASIITEICVTLYQINVVKKEFVYSVRKPYFMTILYAILCMVLVVGGVRVLLDSSPLRLLVSVFCGAITYLLVLMLTQNEIVVMLWKKITSKIKASYFH